MKLFFTKYSLAACATFARKIRFFCIVGLRRSRNLYFRRRSSPTTWSSLIWIGGVCDFAIILISSARISISPVERSLFSVPDFRGLTSPEIFTTYSSLSS